MKNAFIIHGSYGHSQENWFPWLKKELESIRYIAHAPDFPTPENQSLKTWQKVFDPFMSYLDEETIFVGHSLGPAFILNLLEQIDHPIHACFFVAGFTGLFTGKYANPDFDTINQTFTDKEFDWKKIRENCKKFFVYQSDNDPYVAPKKGIDLASNLKTQVQTIEGAGHFNESAGYMKFPKLLDDIQSQV